MQDTAGLNAVLKDVYEGGIRELLPTKVVTFNMFQEKDAKPWGGEGVVYPLKVGRNHGSGAYAEGGALPAAGRQETTNVRIPMRYLAGRISLTKQVIEHSKGNRNAFASAMELEMRGLVNDMTAESGRMIYGDGRGVLALANGDPGTTSTVTVDSPGNVAGATNGSRFINPGQVIAFINPASGALRASSVLTVATVPAAGTTFTTTSACGGNEGDNDYIVKAANTSVSDVADTSYAKEPMGLLGLIDDGTYVSTLHGVNRTTYPIFSSQVISSVGALSADVLQRAIDLADQRGNGSINDILMHHSTRRAYIDMMSGDRRYMGGDLSSPDAGTRAAKGQKLSFGGIPITVDKYAPYGLVFLADTSTWKRYVEVAGEWADDDGSVLKQIGTGTTLQDAFEAYYRIWHNFHIEEPATCARLDGVTATVSVAHID